MVLVELAASRASPRSWGGEEDVWLCHNIRRRVGEGGGGEERDVWLCHNIRRRGGGGERRGMCGYAGQMYKCLNW